MTGHLTGRPPTTKRAASAAASAVMDLAEPTFDQALSDHRLLLARPPACCR
jgi:hypothetical protein